MHPSRIVIEVIDYFRLAKAVIFEPSGAKTTLLGSDDGDALLEAVLARLGYGSIRTVIDGDARQARTLAATGMAITVSITNRVEVDDNGEKDWSCLARVRVDDVEAGSFTLDTTSPLVNDLEMVAGVLDCLGIEVEIADTRST